MSALNQLAGMLGTSQGAAEQTGGLLFGHVIKDMEHNGTVELQGDGHNLSIADGDLMFASGLRNAVKNGDRVLLLRSADYQIYYVLMRME